MRSPLEIVNEELQDRLVLGEELGKRVREKFGSAVAIVSLIEPMPYEGNTVTLDPVKTDHLGLAVPRIAYAPIGEREARTIQLATDVIRRLLQAANARGFRIKKVGLSAHQMGTCRMGSDAGASVVDANLKVHGVDNLYVVGSSVFPTFGAVGPTLSIATLALRLGAHLAGQLAGGRPAEIAPARPSA